VRLLKGTFFLNRERLLYWTALYPFLIGFFFSPPSVYCSSIVLKSPVLHDFGTWGAWDAWLIKIDIIINIFLNKSMALLFIISEM